jgi:hypothetical protein
MQKEAIPEKAIRALKALSQQKVRFVVIGGSALVLHGIPRTTLDVDLMVPVDKENLLRLFLVLSKLKPYGNQEQLLRLLNKPGVFTGQWLTFKDKKNNELIDVLLEDQRKFQKIYRNAKLRRGRSLTLRVISLNDLLKMKKQSTRAIDKADLELIKERLKLEKKR